MEDFTGNDKMCDCGNRGNSACDSGRNCNAAEKRGIKGDERVRVIRVSSEAMEE